LEGQIGRGIRKRQKRTRSPEVAAGVNSKSVVGIARSNLILKLKVRNIVVGNDGGVGNGSPGTKAVVEDDRNDGDHGCEVVLKGNGEIVTAGSDAKYANSDVLAVVGRNANRLDRVCRFVGKVILEHRRIGQRGGDVNCSARPSDTVIAQ
jgi:hypothetical protein